MQRGLSKQVINARGMNTYGTKQEYRQVIYGYARVSTDGQTLDAQQAALSAAGAGKVFQEKISGAFAERKELARLIKALNAGDVVLVTRLDRLARSTRDLLNILDAISAKGAQFRSIAETWADTTTAHGRLLVTVLGGFAEFERELIAARTTEGRRRAKASGKRMGRRPALTPDQATEAIEAARKGEANGSTLARRYNVNPATISRLLAKAGL